MTRSGCVCTAAVVAMLAVRALAQAPAEGKPVNWSFDPNSYKLRCGGIEAFLRPTGDMHGLVIEKLEADGSPTAQGRAFLNLEHYLEAGRWAEYLPRKLNHSVCLDREHLRIEFPQPKDWPVTSALTYRWTRPNQIDARLDFNFSGSAKQFEVYFTSYFDRAYERSVKVGGKWVRPEISDHEQLLIPRDREIAARYGDGRWDFLKGRTRLADFTFELPVLVSREDKSGWTVVQMIEPGKCTHIAPNRFAVGHNYIVGGWDVKAGGQRSARIRMLVGKGLTDEQIEGAYREFAAECGRE